MKQLVAIPITDFKARIERGEKPELPQINEMCKPGEALVIERAADGGFVARIALPSSDRAVNAVSLYPILNPPMPCVALARAMGDQAMVWVVEGA